MRFLLTPPNSSRPVVIVETHSALTPAHEADLSKVMYDQSCAHGMLFDEIGCVVLRDTFAEMGPQSIKVDLRLRTDDVLKLITASTLDKKVETWLALLSTSWDHALPTDATVADLMYDIVPAAVGTSIHIAA